MLGRRDHLLILHGGPDLRGPALEHQAVDTTIGLFYESPDRSYGGTVDGLRFVATYEPRGEHATIEGEFAEDGNSFEAVDTFVVSSYYQLVARHRAVRLQ